MTLVKTNIPRWTHLSDFFDDDWWGTRFRNGYSMPAINVLDNELNYEIELAAPGFNKEDFHVSVENGILTITAKTEKKEEEETKNYTRKEFSSRSFVKSFTLPENVEDEDVKAKYENGVLRLLLNKTEKELPPKKEVMIE